MRLVVLASCLLVACAGEAPAREDAGGPDARAGDAATPAPDAWSGPDARWSCDPEAMVDPNGALVEEPAADCPAGMVAVDTFCIDRYEAALVTAAGAPWSPYFNPGAEVVRA